MQTGRIRFTMLLLVFLAAGCDRPAESGSPPAAPVAEGSSPAASSSSTSTSAPGTPCPRTGRWASCSLEKRLEQSGFVLRRPKGEQPRRSGFSVQPEVYTLGRAWLEVFIYPDENALARDLASLDTTLVAARGQKNDWEIPPRFIRSGNLMAVLLTRNEQQAERVSLAITAGPPQR